MLICLSVCLSVCVCVCVCVLGADSDGGEEWDGEEGQPVTGGSEDILKEQSTWNGQYCTCTVGVYIHVPCFPTLIVCFLSTHSPLLL